MEEISTKSLLYMCAILHIFQNCFERFSSSKQTKLYRKNTLNNNPFESPKLGGVGVQGQGKGSS